jgi:hypothetical protein
MEVFGFHTVDENHFSPDDYSFTETYYDAQNLLNVLGWIPLLGTVVGGIRIGSTGVMWVGDDESHRHSHRKYFAISGVRGVVELLSLGWVFLIPDLIVTASPRRRFKKFRAWKAKNRSQSPKKK